MKAQILRYSWIRRNFLIDQNGRDPDAGSEPGVDHQVVPAKSPQPGGNRRMSLGKIGHRHPVFVQDERVTARHTSHFRLELPFQKSGDPIAARSFKGIHIQTAVHRRPMPELSRLDSSLKIRTMKDLMEGRKFVNSKDWGLLSTDALAKPISSTPRLKAKSRILSFRYLRFFAEKDPDI
jgi:hypothetical protein